MGAAVVSVPFCQRSSEDSAGRQVFLVLLLVALRRRYFRPGDSKLENRPKSAEYTIALQAGDSSPWYDRACVAKGRQEQVVALAFFVFIFRLFGYKCPWKTGSTHA